MSLEHMATLLTLIGMPLGLSLLCFCYALYQFYKLRSGNANAESRYQKLVDIEVMKLINDCRCAAHREIGK